MIIKKRTKPLVLRKYEVLVARLDPSHPRYNQILFEKQKQERGYQGERQVDYHLDIFSSRFTILQDVCLSIYGRTSQLDNLLISPHAIYLVEVKNFKHTIIFDTNLNQFTRDNGKKETGYSHPITQLQLQKHRLQQWLQNNNLPNIPIYTYLAISEPSTIIKVEGNHEQISRIVAHGEQIPWKISNLEGSLQSSEKYNHQKIGHTILRNCKEYDRDILADHQISPKEVLGGIRCTECNTLGMKRVKWTWVCRRCNRSDEQAASYSINDYLLLVKPWMTNIECKQFLQLDSRHKALRILKKCPHLTYEPTRRRWIKRRRKNQ